MEGRKAPQVVMIMAILVIILLVAIANGSAWAASLLNGELNWESRHKQANSELMAADIQVDQEIQGQFVSPGKSAVFSIVITNKSITETDSVEIGIDSSWPTQLFQADGYSPLDDDNNDGRVETSSIAPGTSIEIFAQITAPVSATIGDSNQARLHLYSSLDPSFSKLVLLQTAIPAPFSQAFRHETTSEAGIYIAQKDSQQHHVISSRLNAGTEIAIAETSDGYIYVWSYQRIDDNAYVAEIETIFVNKDGNSPSELKKITEHLGVSMSTFDVSPVVSVDRDGQIGISWHRQVYDAYGNINENIFAIILDAAGQPITEEINLTGNTHWAPRGTVGVPAYDTPRISKIADGGFFTAWQTDLALDTGRYQDIYFSILAGNGEISVTPTNLTNDNAEDSGNVAPALAGLSTDGTLVSWIMRRSGNDDLFIAVVNRAGDIIHGPSDISEDDSVTDWWNFGANELSDGSILVAWQAWGCIEGEYTGRIRYAVLGGNYRRIGRPSCMGPIGLAVGGDRSVSLTSDANSNGIITWTDHNASSRQRMYYALVDRKGNIVTEPTIFYNSSDSGDFISLNSEGYANTSRSYIDGSIQFSKSQYVVSAGDQAITTIRYGNGGTLDAAPVFITATLDTDLTYVGDTAPRRPVIIGNSITWELPGLEAASSSEFDLFASTPTTATLGSSYPVSVTLSLTATESIASNNNDTTAIVIQRPVYIPLILK